MVSVRVNIDASRVLKIMIRNSNIVKKIKTQKEQCDNALPFIMY